MTQKNSSAFKSEDRLFACLASSRSWSGFFLVLLIFLPSQVFAVSSTQIDGHCGIANGAYPNQVQWDVYSDNSSNLCDTGKVSALTGAGPWNWLCVGSGGGVTASCSAKPPVDGVCGLDSNLVLDAAPKSNLCLEGNASSVMGADQWAWSCRGKHGGANAKCTAFKQTNLGMILEDGGYESNAAQLELPALCTNHTESYPAQWTWDANKTKNQPRAAQLDDNLTPKIDQVRNGQVIATYTSFGSDPQTCRYNQPTQNIPIDLNLVAAKGCGPFGDIPHIDTIRFWHDGDTFLVYPAVYTGSENNLVLMQKRDYYGGPYFIPKNITIKGVIRNGIRPVIYNTPPANADFASVQAPVYISKSADITIENIDIDNGAITDPFGKAGVYIDGAKNLTLRQMRIHGFEIRGVNGVFATWNNSGTLNLHQIEVYDNGGGNGPAHNIYINASEIDPNFTVSMVNSWSHDAFYGHAFKSRAQINILQGNYFQGGVPQGNGHSQAENYLVDIPNGGVLQMFNNILVKNESGSNSNGASITYGVEGFSAFPKTPERTFQVDIQNNTFVAFAQSYDGLHPLWPFFFWHDLVPGKAGFEVPNSTSTYVVPEIDISNNVFVGYCPQLYRANDFMNYRGDYPVTVSFGELNTDFSLKNPVLSKNLSVAGTPSYSHEIQAGLLRQTLLVEGMEFTAIGAEDN